MSGRRRKFWGWGFEDQQPPQDEVERLGLGAREHLGFGPAEVECPARLDDLELTAPRIEAPAALQQICRSDLYERASHSYGRGYRDVVSAFRGRFDHPPDVVAHPRDERDVEHLLEWCSDAGGAAIPFGGGTSVVGGVEPRVAQEAAVAIDLKGMGRVLEVDSVSRAARVGAGATGPQLEAELKHASPLPAVVRVLHAGRLDRDACGRPFRHAAHPHRRFRGVGAGDHSERGLGEPPPLHRESAAVLFDSFAYGAMATRALAQTRLFPTNRRLLDPGEAALTGAAPGGKALLVLGFEGGGEVGGAMAQALELCGDHHGTPREKRGESEGAWRDAFVQAPYLRDTLIAAGIFAETFETAITWDRSEHFVGQVREAAEGALGGQCRVTCRLTHVYPDGAAPYFTVLAPARRGHELEQWDEIKTAASDVIVAAGGTITHHHAVGRDHRQWYDRQRPDLFAAALRAAKKAVDPSGILNPGVLIDP